MTTQPPHDSGSGEREAQADEREHPTASSLERHAGTAGVSTSDERALYKAWQMSLAWAKEPIVAWAAWQARAALATPSQAPEPAAAKALEFAEYMAKGGEQLLEAINTRFGAVEARDNLEGDASEDDLIAADQRIDRAEEALSDFMRGFSADIYEFRKRAAKVGPSQAVASALQAPAWVDAKDRLPPANDWYAITITDPSDLGLEWSTDRAWMAWFEDGEFFNCLPLEEGCLVVAWMNIPVAGAAPAHPVVQPGIQGDGHQAGASLQEHATEGRSTTHDSPACPNCDGSGEAMAMTSHLGPDDYEFLDTCPHCGGSGELADAYAGVVKLLEAEEKSYLRVAGQLWGACHARDVAAWRWRGTKGEGPWTYCDDRNILLQRPRDAETQCLYPPLEWKELSASKPSPSSAGVPLPGASGQDETERLLPVASVKRGGTDTFGRATLLERWLDQASELPDGEHILYALIPQGTHHTGTAGSTTPAVSLPIQSVGLWRRSLERMPEPGQLIVKRWDHNRAVWAGVYSGSPKDGSFDEWCALATPHQGSDGSAEESSSTSGQTLRPQARG